MPRGVRLGRADTLLPGVRRLRVPVRTQNRIRLHLRTVDVLRVRHVRAAEDDVEMESGSDFAGARRERSGLRNPADRLAVVPRHFPVDEHVVWTRLDRAVHHSGDRRLHQDPLLLHAVPGAAFPGRIPVRIGLHRIRNAGAVLKQSPRLWEILKTLIW